MTAQGGDVSATRVGVGARGRGLFASRDVHAGEVVLRVPIGAALNDGRGTPPYPDAPWSVVLAAELLRERARGEDARLCRYVRSLPSETIGFANSSLATGDVFQTRRLLADEAASDELERYDSVVRGSAMAVQDAHSLEEWRWAMSLAHSRTFRVDEPTASAPASSSAAPGKTIGATRRLMVPYVDLLNHDSRDDVWQCEWSCVWDLGGGDGAFIVRTTRDVKKGEELVISYGERDDRHFFLFFGFLPDPNPRNAVALFRGLEDAAAWYETLCGDTEDTKCAWLAARRRAVATVRAETESTPRLSNAEQSTTETDEGDHESDDSESLGEGWTSADAEAEEAASLRVGANASVDDRLIRLFEILSGDPEVAVAAVRVRARHLLDSLDEAEERIQAETWNVDAETGFALELAAGYRARRRALLAEIA